MAEAVTDAGSKDLNWVRWPSWRHATEAQRADISAFTRSVYLSRAIRNTTTRHEMERLARHTRPGELPCGCCKKDLDKIVADYRRMAG